MRVGKTWSRLPNNEMLLKIFKLLNKEFSFFIADILHFKQNSIIQVSLCTKMPVREKIQLNKFLNFKKKDYYMTHHRKTKKKKKEVSNKGIRCERGY